MLEDRVAKKSDHRIHLIVEFITSKEVPIFLANLLEDLEAHFDCVWILRGLDLLEEIIWELWPVCLHKVLCHYADDFENLIGYLLRLP